jgi:hypothetical protein
VRPKPDIGSWEIISGLGLALLASLWASTTYFALQTHGVTGSDPYAYVQMAVDLARHGTLLHTFSLAPQVAQWNLPDWPVAPVGYLPPHLQTGQAATVWPPGYSALLAAAYLVGGEPGLYLLPPLMGLSALMALWWLSLEVLRSWPVERRFLAAGIAVFVLATSYRQVEGAALPMADVPSQLFTMLAVYCALRAVQSPEFPRRKNLEALLFAALSGLCLGVAFSIRYTQVLLAISLLFLLAFSPRPLRSPTPLLPGSLALRLLLFSLAAALAALPVLGYHALAFGNPFRTGSGELALFGWQYILPSAVALARELLRTNEFVYLTPFVLWGAARLWRSFRREMVALVLWLSVLAVFHLPYAALRARDLLAVFPVLALWAGAGVSDLIRWAFERRAENGQPQPALDSPSLRAALVVLATVILLFARVRVTLQWPLHPERFNTFGYLTAEQRAAFDTLKGLTPSGAIVAASLNSGAVGLYAERDAVRPGSWSQGDWLEFVRQSMERGSPLYLLADGEEMQAPAQALPPAYTLQPVAELSLPYFYPDGRAEDRLVPLYLVASGAGSTCAR